MERAGPDELLGEFHAIQNELKTGEYRPYRRLLSEVTLELGRRRGWEVTDEEAGLVPAAIPGWAPFPDTNAALARLHDAGVRLGILSNIDDDLLAGTLTHLEVRFEKLVTAESLASYKPTATHFEAGQRWIEDEGGRVGPGPESDEAGRATDWLHVAQSLFHDIEPATTLGISTVWVNRKDEVRSPGAWPVHIAPTLAEAVDWILGPRG